MEWEVSILTINLLDLDQTEARSAEKKFLETTPPPYFRVWVTAPLLYLDPAL